MTENHLQFIVGRHIRVNVYKFWSTRLLDYAISASLLYVPYVRATLRKQRTQLLPNCLGQLKGVGQSYHIHIRQSRRPIENSTKTGGHEIDHTPICPLPSIKLLTSTPSGLSTAITSRRVESIRTINIDTLRW